MPERISRIQDGGHRGKFRPEVVCCYSSGHSESLDRPAMLTVPLHLESATGYVRWVYGGFRPSMAILLTPLEMKELERARAVAWDPQEWQLTLP